MSDDPIASVRPATGVVAVCVPASSANLGPGYDSFGLALGLYNDFEARIADTWTVSVHGEGASHLRTDERNLVARSCIAALAELGAEAAVPAAAIVCRNGIPTGRGLGSSSAAIVGGIALGWLLAGLELDRDAMFALANRLEGHPDNVGAAVYGGFTVCACDTAGVAHCHSLPVAGGLAAIVVTREQPLRTEAARSMLPATVPHADAAFNAGHAGLTVAGLLLGRPDLLSQGLADRLHEPYRAAAVPDLAELRELLLAAGADAAALSGAGPTVVGIVTAGDDAAAFARAHDVAAAAEPSVGRLIGRRTPLPVPIDRVGVAVS